MLVLPRKGRVLGFTPIFCHGLHGPLPTDNQELPALQGLREEQSHSREEAPGDIDNAPPPPRALPCCMVAAPGPVSPGWPWHPVAPCGLPTLLHTGLGFVWQWVHAKWVLFLWGAAHAAKGELQPSCSYQ